MTYAQFAQSHDADMFAECREVLLLSDNRADLTVAAMTLLLYSEYDRDKEEASYWLKTLQYDDATLPANRMVQEPERAMTGWMLGCLAAVVALIAVHGIWGL